MTLTTSISTVEEYLHLPSFVCKMLYIIVSKAKTKIILYMFLQKCYDFNFEFMQWFDVFNMVSLYIPAINLSFATGRIA